MLRELAVAEVTGSRLCAVAGSIDDAAVAGNQRCPPLHHTQYHRSKSSQKEHRAHLGGTGVLFLMVDTSRDL